MAGRPRKHTDSEFSVRQKVVSHKTGVPPSTPNASVTVRRFHDIEVEPSSQGAKKRRKRQSIHTILPDNPSTVPLTLAEDADEDQLEEQERDFLRMLKCADDIVEESDSTDNDQQEDITPSKRVERMREFQRHAQECLNEVIRLEAPPLDLRCYTCGRGCEHLHRCTECFDNNLRCASCMLDDHKALPFHSISVWNGTFFNRTRLEALGQILQLGHDNAYCPNPSHNKRLTVLHTNGIHGMTFRSCECPGAVPIWQQMIRHRLWPATFTYPSTAITIAALDHFQHFVHQAHVNAFDYYQALSIITDNTGLAEVKSRYDDFSVAARCHRYIKLMKRFGRGHDTHGVQGTQEGSLAVECPACPHPGKNLFVGHENLPKWQSSLFVSMDGNFRLKLKNRKNETDEPLVGAGSYWVNQHKFNDYVEKHKGEEYIQICESRFRAIDHANKRSRDYRYQGVAATVCARHIMLLPNSVGNMPRGEAYSIVDFVALSAVSHTPVNTVVFTYDLGCNWSVNLRDRLTQLPPEIALRQETKRIRVAVPDFHLAGHGRKCQSIYSLLRLPQIGRCCGEGVETKWAITNGDATTTREMAMNAREELLSDQWGYQNWRKIVDMCSYLARKFNEATRTLARQQVILDGFSSTLNENDLAAFRQDVAAWDKLVEAWEAGGHKTRQQPDTTLDPYQYAESGMTLKAVEDELIAQEAVERRTSLIGEELTPTRWLTLGIALEGQQRDLHAFKRSAMRKDGNVDTLCKDSLATRRDKLMTSIRTWQRQLPSYLPSSALDGSYDASTILAENVALSLPSQLPASQTKSDPYNLHDVELQLRIAQCEDSLAVLRHNLGLRRHLTHYKRTHVDGSGGRPNTRLQTIIVNYTTKVNQQANTYRAGRAAIIALSPSHPILMKYLPLDKDDVRFPSMRQLDELEEACSNETTQYSKKGTGQSREEISWIWTIGKRTFSSDRLTDQRLKHDLKVEWARAHSRVMRWSEETELLQVEMRRVLTYCEWKASWWKSWVVLEAEVIGSVNDRSTKTDSILLMGRNAYAYEQASMWEDLAARCAATWIPILKKHGHGHGWGEELSKRWSVRRLTYIY